MVEIGGTWSRTSACLLCEPSPVAGAPCWLQSSNDDQIGRTVAANEELRRCRLESPHETVIVCACLD
jgi:hypothetical protein